MHSGPAGLLQRTRMATSAVQGGHAMISAKLLCLPLQAWTILRNSFCPRRHLRMPRRQGLSERLFLLLCNELVIGWYGSKLALPLFLLYFTCPPCSELAHPC